MTEPAIHQSNQLRPCEAGLQFLAVFLTGMIVGLFASVCLKSKTRSSATLQKNELPGETPLQGEAYQQAAEKLLFIQGIVLEGVLPRHRGRFR